MNTTTAHNIPLIIQAIGYVAFVFSIEQGVTQQPCIIRYYKTCTCPPNDQFAVITALTQKAGCSDHDDSPNGQALKYPIGVVSDELYMTGGYRYD